jgi:FdhD protein
MLKTDVLKVDVPSGKVSKVSDYVAQEKPLYIFVNKVHYATIFCSPSNLKELTVGHLLSEGIVKSVKEIEEVNLKMEDAVCNVRLKPNVDAKKRLKLSSSFSRIILSACGSRSPYQFSGKLPKVKSRLSVKAETVFASVNRLNFIAETFRKTGGVHIAAICDSEGNVKGFAEDVGRHNAVDKAIGIAALNGIELSDCFLALSGRLTGDIALKAARVGLPIVASLAAAIDSGIAVARSAGLTLIGFVRGKRMNIYTFPERIFSVSVRP